MFRDHIKPRLVAVAFAIPNNGHRAKQEAIKIKTEGAEAGVPDIFALHLRQVYFLEMKKAKGGRVKDQNFMMTRLTTAGDLRGGEGAAAGNPAIGGVGPPGGRYGDGRARGDGGMTEQKAIITAGQLLDIVREETSEGTYTKLRQ